MGRRPQTSAFLWSKGKRRETKSRCLSSASPAPNRVTYTLSLRQGGWLSNGVLHTGEVSQPVVSMTKGVLPLRIFKKSVNMCITESLCCTAETGTTL